MRILVMGAGALGGYFGARLQAVGHDVTYVARGAHLTALQENGLKLLSPKGDLHLEHVNAVAHPSEANLDEGPFDVVLFMVKNADVEPAAEAIRPAIGDSTAVLTCQNGVTAPERLGGVIGLSHVVPGVARIPGDIASPGVIRHSGQLDMMSFGEIDGTMSARVEALKGMLEEAGTTPVVPESIIHDLWHKFTSQATLASMTTLLRLDMGPIRANPASWQLFYDGMAETFAVARARVPDLPEETLETAWAWVHRLHDTMHSSMLDDLNRGKPLEVEYLSGDVVRLGAEVGVPTPVHQFFSRALAPFAAGTPTV